MLGKHYIGHWVVFSPLNVRGAAAITYLLQHYLLFKKIQNFFSFNENKMFNFCKIFCTKILICKKSGLMTLGMKLIHLAHILSQNRYTRLDWNICFNKNSGLLCGILNPQLRLTSKDKKDKNMILIHLFSVS